MSDTSKLHPISKAVLRTNPGRRRILWSWGGDSYSLQNRVRELNRMNAETTAYLDVKIYI